MIFLIGISLVLVSHQMYFSRPWLTPYAFHRVNDQDLKVYNLTKIPGSLWGVFWQGSDHPAAPKPLLISMPILWLMPFGLRRLVDKIGRAKVVALATGFMAVLMFYGAHPAFSGWHLRYGASHYLKIWFPLLTLAGTLGLLEIVGCSRKILSFGQR